MSQGAPDLANELVEYISTELAGDRQEAPVEKETDLLGSGILDSLAVMRLVTFIERRCDLTIPPADITIEHFMTVSGIVGYLESLESYGGTRSES